MDVCVTVIVLKDSIKPRPLLGYTHAVWMSVSLSVSLYVSLSFCKGQPQALVAAVNLFTVGHEVPAGTCKPVPADRCDVCVTASPAFIHAFILLASQNSADVCHCIVACQHSVHMKAFLM